MILRRTDAWFCDPLELRPDSKLGVPGLVEAARLGGVSIVNTLGSGVLENPGLLPFLPRLAEHLLGEPLLLPSVPTWWCGDEESRRHVLANLERLVIKPDRPARPARRRCSPGSSATSAGTTCGAGSKRDPPTGSARRPSSWPRRRRSPRPVSRPGQAVLRAFAVARQDSYAAMPGGLTRVAAQEASRVAPPKAC